MPEFGPIESTIHRNCPARAPEVAALVRRLREERGLTQFELAQRMDSTQSMVARWETGEHDFSLKTLSRIAAALEVRIELTLDDIEVTA